MNKPFKLKPWLGVLGFLGFLGFIPNHQGEPQYFFCMFFLFFGFYFWAKLSAEQTDERLIANQMRALRIIAACFALLSFFILFFLQKHYINRDAILLVGSLGYAAVFILAPVLVLYFDRMAD